MRLIFCFLFLISFNLYSQKIGKLLDSHKSVFKIHDNKSSHIGKYDLIFSGDMLKTIDNKAKLLLDDSTYIIMEKGSKIKFSKYNLDIDKRKRIVSVELKSGSAKFKLTENFSINNYAVKSGDLTIKISENSSFIISNSKIEGVEVFVISGSVNVLSNFEGASKVKLYADKKLKFKNKNSSFKIENMSEIEKKTLNMNYEIESENVEINRNNKFREVSKEKAIEYSKDYISQMIAILKHSFIELKKARKEKNLLKVNCINDNVLTIKAYLRRSEDDKLQIDKSEDLKIISSLLSKINFAFSNSKQAGIAIKSCIGDVLKYENKDSVSIDIERINVENDNNTKKDVFRPVPISPFF